MMCVKRCVAPKVWVYRVGRRTTISQKIVSSGVNYFAAFVVNDPIFSASRYKPSRNALYVCRVELTTVSC
jgi:hypothetical protein